MLNTLCTGLILISAFGMVATRQVQGVLRFFIVQSFLLAVSAAVLGFGRNSVPRCNVEWWRSQNGSHVAGADPPDAVPDQNLRDLLLRETSGQCR